MTLRRDQASPLSIPLSGLVPARVVARPNRFVAEVVLGGATGRIVTAHVADSGRLKELIFPGNLVMVRKAVPATDGEQDKAQRKTNYDLVLASAVEGGDDQPVPVTPDDLGAQPGDATPQRRVWVSVDTRYPNMLFGQALRAGALKEFDCACTVCQEHWYHHLSPWKEEDEGRAAGKAPSRPVRSRMDFYLDGGSRDRCCLIEVKSVTLCKDGVGLFPDAPTDRGARHLRELARAVEAGYRAYAVFIAQRDDIRIIKPNRETDPAFADALEHAAKAGVRLIGYRCRITPEEISRDPAAIPVVT